MSKRLLGKHHMISKDQYQHLKQKIDHLFQEKREYDTEYKKKCHHQQTEIKTQIDNLFKQRDAGTITQDELQNRIHNHMKSHTENIMKLSGDYHADNERITQRLFDAINEVNQHQNLSFMMGMRQISESLRIHPETIHWDIYFRHKNFSALSGVIFLSTADTEWTYPNGERGTVEQLTEQHLPTLLHAFRWLEGYNEANDILVIKLLDIDYSPRI